MRSIIDILDLSPAEIEGLIAAQPHIAPAEEVGAEQLEQDILRGLKE